MEVSREISKDVKLSENENITHQNLAMGHSHTAMLRGTFIALNDYLRREKQHLSNLKNLEKEEQNKPTTITEGKK